MIYLVDCHHAGISSLRKTLRDLKIRELFKLGMFVCSVLIRRNAEVITSSADFLFSLKYSTVRKTSHKVTTELTENLF